MIRASWKWLSTLIAGSSFVARWNPPAAARPHVGGLPQQERALALVRAAALQMKVRTIDLLTLQADDMAVRRRRHLLVEFEIAPRVGGTRVYLALNTIISSSC
jgi:hypothetical protein